MIRIPIVHTAHDLDTAHAYVTPDIARQIVGLAYGATGWLPPGPDHPVIGGIICTQPHTMGGQGPQPAQPSGDDAATVQAIVDGMKANTGTMHGMAIGALAAIRAGKVPGLCDPRHVSGLYDAAQGELAALRAKIKRIQEVAGT